MRKNTCLLLALFLLLTVAWGVPSHAAYPERPITLLVGFQAGGTADIMARMLARTVGETLGQAVVVSNKPGSGGGVAVMELKNAKPDGYTLCATVALTFNANPHSMKTDYTVEDFTYIAAGGKFQEAFVTSPDKPWKNWAGLIKGAKEAGSVSYASMIQIDKLITKYIGQKEGTELKAVPTKGGSEVATAVMGGHVDFGFSGGIHYAYAKAGQMVVLAATGRDRLSDFPEVPTLKELGYDIFLDNFLTIAAPKGTPQEVIARLAGAFEKAVKAPEYQELLKEKLHFPALYMGPSQVTDQLRESSESIRKMVQSLK